MTLSDTLNFDNRSRKMPVTIIDDSHLKEMHNFWLQLEDIPKKLQLVLIDQVKSLSNLDSHIALSQTIRNL